MARSNPIPHCAPAGTMYSSIEEAGSCLLQEYCENYPNSDRSFILPPLSSTNYPEMDDITSTNIDKHSRVLTKKEENRFSGIASNQRGERSEYLVASALRKLVTQPHGERLLVLCNFCLDSDNSKGIKRKVIKEDLLTIDLNGINTRGENDVLVVVKNLGIVFIEIKASSLGDSIAKAEEQLHKVNAFAKRLMDAIVGRSSTSLPTVKVIIVTGGQPSNPAPKTDSGCHVWFRDGLDAFKTKWEEVVEELNQMTITNSYTHRDFERLTRVLTGVWCMKPIAGSSHTYDDSEASTGYKIESVDTMLKQATLSSDEKKKKTETEKIHPVTNIVRTKVDDVFRLTDDIKLLYLTPSQKDLFDNYMHAIIRGHAGTGKTLLVLFKIMELKLSQTKEKMLLIAPYPHHLRCRNTLIANGVDVELLAAFPPPTSTTFNHLSNKVFIMQLRDFFGVTKETLMSYDLSKYHIFTDDLQNFSVESRTKATYHDIGNFIEQTYFTSRKNDLFAWFGIDIVQSVHLEDDGEEPLGLFITTDGKPRPYEIPIFSLEHVLRNAEEITKIVVEARSQRITDYVRESSHVIPNIYHGHKITSEVARYHKLVEGTNKHRETFVCKRIQDELMFTTQKYPFPLANVAILFSDQENLDKYKKSICSMLLKNFNVATQTIAEQLESGNAEDIILDVCKNVMSFESPCVIWVRTTSWGSSAEPYNVMSRARTLLVIIDIKTNKPPLDYKNINFIEWKEEDNKFVKCIRGQDNE